MGKPVIAGKSGGVADAVVDQFNGLLVDPENSEAIAIAINQLLLDSDLVKKLGEQGKNRAQQDFSWSAQSKKLHQYLHLYFNL